MRTAVIVLGDLGRSPRMQYHAQALAAEGDVDLVGLAGAPLHAAVAAEPRIHSHRLPDRFARSRAAGSRRRFVFASALRAAYQAWQLFWHLLRLPRPDVMLVQTPPASPSLAVAWLVARLRRARLVIDWHNLAHSVLAVRLGETHRAVRALRRAERRWARRAAAHLTVSHALAAWLGREHRIEAAVVYDRPTRVFQRSSADAVRACRGKLARTLNLASPDLPLVVSPTSWTPDEDFDLLIEALERAERQLFDIARTRGGEARLPAMVVLLTGQGPGRDAFERRIARRAFQAIAVRTTWLDPEDYPVVIAAADLGLCLHQSSSGLDLPIKLADFRGASVPVCAFDFAPVLAEALTSGQEGIVFRDPGSLAAILVELGSGSSATDSAISHSREWLRQHPAERWEDHWTRTARSVVALSSAERAP